MHQKNEVIKPSAFSLKLLRKITVPFLRKQLLKYFFKQHGARLQDLLSFDNGKFFIYQVDDIFIPDESLYWPVDFNSKIEKGKNESMFAYEPKRGDTVIDIGAGLGEETLLFSKLVKEKGKVFAVEANASVFKVLKQTIALNNLSNVSAFNIAIYQDDGLVSLADMGGSYEEVFVKEAAASGHTVRAVRMDHFIEEQGIDYIDFLKVNIEGAERFMVDTLTKQHLSMIRHAAVACHDFRYRKEGNDFFKTKAHVLEFFKKNGFDIYTRQTGTDYIDDWVYAKNRSL